MLHHTGKESAHIDADFGAVWIDIGDNKRVCATWDDFERTLTILAMEVVPEHESVGEPT